MTEDADSTEKAIVASSPPPSTCKLKVKMTYPGKPTLAVVTSRPGANGAVTYQRLDDNGNPLFGAIGAAKIPIL